MDYQKQSRFEIKTGMVVLLTALTMVVEIYFGLRTKSMALLADGIHMGSHVLALGLSWLAYVIVRKLRYSERYTGEPGKILSLSGYTSGLILLAFAIVIMTEAIQRIISPSVIQYKEAIIVAFIGLAVNIVSALILRHDRKHSDNNIRAAYLHVIADALTSIAAIIGLIAALLWNLVRLDSIAGIISSFVIIKWSISIMKDSGRDLLGIDHSDSENSGTRF
jgi:cobalt-zinc-cadmium efflux system protein